MNLSEQIESTVNYIRSITDFEPELGLILGSGLGSYAEQLEDPVFIDYSDIPGFPVSTVVGHAGRFVLGKRFGKRVIAMQGRFHYYEGYTQGQVTLPVRVMKKLGAPDLLLTNAAGGVNRDFPVGALMLITDHINYSGMNPLAGPNLEEFGPRFPDMTDIYTKELRGKAKQLAADAGIPLQEGVYVMFSGPSYETPAEIRMARTIGADAVGMSTAPEAIVARHCGMRVMGISCITNFAAGILDAPLVHEEVVAVTTRVNREFVALLDILIKEAF
ncbi:MAG: purine-nucleoside phosphorylase [Clostridiales Family XIII bacterium]|nr:purine-nucleoside phosphorylase [Clostridiales Family XIII bacterium]